MGTESKRFYFIDTWRGLCIIHMVIYHLLYDLVELFDVSIPWFWSWGFQTLRDFFAGGFIFLAGVSCFLSRNNLKRGIQVFGLGLLLSAVTFLLMPSQFIAFGILHLLGSCMILFAIFEKWLKKIHNLWWIVLFFVLFLLLSRVPYGKIGYFGLEITMPPSLYRTNFLFPVGLPSSSFSSSDYYPLIPWLFVFLSGTVFGNKLKKKELPQFIYGVNKNVVATLGSHSLVIYLVHQPLIYGVLWLASSFL